MSNIEGPIDYTDQVAELGPKSELLLDLSYHEKDRSDYLLQVTAQPRVFGVRAVNGKKVSGPPILIVGSGETEDTINQEVWFKQNEIVFIADSDGKNIIKLGRLASLEVVRAFPAS